MVRSADGEQTVKPWSVGIIGLAGLAAIVAGAYASPEALLAVAALAAAGIGIGWPHFLGIPAKKTLAVLIGLPGVGVGRGCRPISRLPASWTGRRRSWPSGSWQSSSCS